jgi:hypothetical protein
MGPSAIAEKKFSNEIHNHRESRGYAAILPEIYEEFTSSDGFVRGYIMEFVDGILLEKLIPSTPLSKSHPQKPSTLTLLLGELLLQQCIEPA